MSRRELDFVLALSSQFGYRMFAGNVYGHLGTPVHPLKDPAQRDVQFFRYPEDLSVEAPSDLEVGHLKRDKITVTFSLTD